MNERSEFTLMQCDLSSWAPLATGRLSAQTQSFIPDRTSKLPSPSIFLPKLIDINTISAFLFLAAPTVFLEVISSP